MFFHNTDLSVVYVVFHTSTVPSGVWQRLARAVKPPAARHCVEFRCWVLFVTSFTDVGGLNRISTFHWHPRKCAVISSVPFLLFQQPISENQERAIICCLLPANVFFQVGLLYRKKAPSSSYASSGATSA